MASESEPNIAEGSSRKTDTRLPVNLAAHLDGRRPGRNPQGRNGKRPAREDLLGHER
jgi:hypothetical protein